MKLEMLESFFTGHPEIDADHRKIIDVINLVDDAITNNELGQCRRLLDSFLEVAKEHFDREEEILKKIGFPDVDNHQTYHEDMLDRAEAVKNLCREMKDQGHIKECFDEMVGFLIDDVVRGDSVFVSYMIDKGIVKR
jgi:hemerythrin